MYSSTNSERSFCSCPAVCFVVGLVLFNVVCRNDIKVNFFEQFHFLFLFRGSNNRIATNKSAPISICTRQSSFSVELIP